MSQNTEEKEKEVPKTEGNPTTGPGGAHAQNPQYQFSYPYYFNPYTYYYGYNVQQPFFMTAQHNAAAAFPPTASPQPLTGVPPQNTQAASPQGGQPYNIPPYNFPPHMYSPLVQPPRTLLDPRRAHAQSSVPITTPFLLVTSNAVPTLPTGQLIPPQPHTQTASAATQLQNSSNAQTQNSSNAAAAAKNTAQPPNKEKKVIKIENREIFEYAHDRTKVRQFSAGNAKNTDGGLENSQGQKKVSDKLKEILAPKPSSVSLQMNKSIDEKINIAQTKIEMKLRNLAQNQPLKQDLKIFQKEIKAVNEEKEQSRKIPKDLEDYVKRCFQACKNDNEKDRMENVMRKFLKSVITDKSAYSTDWTIQPLINLNQRKNKRFNKKNIGGNISLNIGGNLDEDSSEIGQDSSNFGVNSLNLRKKSNIGNLSFNQSGINNLGNKNKNRFNQIDNAKKMERLNRFELKSLNTPITATVDTHDQTQIIGLSTALEKQYLRLTTNADPNTVRPLHILKDSFNHVLSTFKKNNNYDYVLEQLKSIRQDLTIQGIRNDFTVKVYEENARLAIMNKDRGEFNQCQTCLKQLYKEGIPGNESEFTVYTILYLTYMKNHLEMVGLVSSLPLSLKSKNFIHSAIKLYTAHINSNYIKFFRIYKRLLELPLAKYLIDMFIDTIRVSALKAMISSFMPKIPQSYIISVLSFDGVNHLHTWMKEKEIDFEGDKDLDCKALRQIVFNV